MLTKSRIAELRALDPRDWWNEDCDAALDTIERLAGALQEIADWPREYEVCSIARAALAELEEPK